VNTAVDPWRVVDLGALAVVLVLPRLDIDRGSALHHRCREDRVGVRGDQQRHSYITTDEDPWAEAAREVKEERVMTKPVVKARVVEALVSEACVPEAPRLNTAAVKPAARAIDA